MTSLAAVFRALESAGIALDVESARDAFWLAAELAAARAGAQAEDRSVSGQAGEGEVDGSGAGQAKTKAESAAAPAPGPPPEPPRAAAPERAGRSIPAGALSRVSLPLAAGLSGERGVPAALRPLRRRVRSAAGGIDEAATVRRALENDLWLPIHRHVAERWLELTLVVDGSVSMGVWQDVARELRRVLMRAAAFRDVRVWRLETEGDAVGTLSTWSRAADRPARQISRPPFGGGRRGLVLVMTDCVSSAWYDGRLLSLLRRWSEDAPVALLQVLPERMWARTALGEAIAVRVRATRAAATNSHLHWVADWPVQEAGWRSQDTRVGRGLCLLPVVTSDPRSLRRLARMVAGTSSESVTGMLFDTASVGDPVGEAPPAPAADRVRRFWSVSSSAAAELASLLAAAPVHSTGMLRLLRRELMPAADTSAEAEVLLSGLVAAPAEADVRAGDLPLQIAADVRQILLENAPVDRVLEVLRQVAARMPLPGITAETFESWLVNPSSGQAQLNPGDDEVGAQVAAVLEQIGGPYARIVHAEARRPPPVPEAPQANAEPASSPATPASAAPDSAPEPDVRVLRVFISSPSDTAEEREAVRAVIDELNPILGKARGIKLEAVSWADPPAVANPQNPISPPPEDSDIYVGIFADRVGVRLSGSDLSGTEWELNQALERSRRIGRPRILLYFRDPRPVKSSIGSTKMSNNFDQSQQVMRIREAMEAQTHTRSFSGLKEFRAYLLDDLSRSAEEITSDQPVWLKEFRPPADFVGRQAELDQLFAWWRDDHPGPRALAVVGPPGIGKSSLARAWLQQLVAQHGGNHVFAAHGSRPVEEVLRDAVRYFTGVVEQFTDVRQVIDALAAALHDQSGSLVVIDGLDEAGGEDQGVWAEALRAIAASNARLLIFSRDPPPFDMPVMTLGDREPHAAGSGDVSASRPTGALTAGRFGWDAIVRVQSAAMIEAIGYLVGPRIVVIPASFLLTDNEFGVAIADGVHVGRVVERDDASDVALLLLDGGPTGDGPFTEQFTLAGDRVLVLGPGKVIATGALGAGGGQSTVEFDAQPPVVVTGAPIVLSGRYLGHIGRLHGTRSARSCDGAAVDALVQRYYLRRIAELTNTNQTPSLPELRKTLRSSELVARLRRSTIEELYRRGGPLRLAALIAVQEAPSAEHFDLVFEALEGNTSGDERAELDQAAIAINPLLDQERQSMLHPHFSTGTPQWVFGTIGRRAGEIAARVNKTYRFQLSGILGGTWFVDLREGSAGVRQSDDKADCTITMEVRDFLALVDGKLNAQMFFMTGKMKVAGDMGLAMKLGAVLSLAQPRQRT